MFVVKSPSFGRIKLNCTRKYKKKDTNICGGKEHVKENFMFLLRAHSKGGEVNNINKQELLLVRSEASEGMENSFVACCKTSCSQHN